MNTRIAPSPTGLPHIGLLRTAYINYLAAKSSGGKFIIRIDDTDVQRSTAQFADAILSAFDAYGIASDLIFKQSDRLNVYHNRIDQLINSGNAYRADDGTVRLRCNYSVLNWNDQISGVIPITDQMFQSINNMVLMRSDGSPTYNFASVIDDIDFDIDTVIRGVDHVSNTPKQIYIYNALNASLPDYYHIGLIFQNGKKISKRDAIFNLDYYKDIHPDALLNCLLRLGWSHSNPNIDKKHPLIDRDLAIQIYSDGHLTNRNCTLDAAKLKWYHLQYSKIKYL